MISTIKAKLIPEEVRDHIVFNCGFYEKKELIYKLFKVSKFTKEIINKLNSMRNAVAHRYDENDKRFVYKQKNILHNYNSLVKFFSDCLLGIDEVQKIDTSLLDAIDKAEKEYG